MNYMRNHQVTANEWTEWRDTFRVQFASGPGRTGRKHWDVTIDGRHLVTVGAAIVYDGTSPELAREAYNEN